MKNIKPIDVFIEELSKYINANVVGRKDTYITNCEKCPKRMNRGHGIQVTLKLPEGLDPEGNMRPVFYAEELMAQLPGYAIAAVGEFLNRKVTETYSQTLRVIELQKEMLTKGIDDVDEDSIILTAMLASEIPEGNKTKFVTRSLPEYGLVVTMKSRRAENPNNPNESYYIPVMNKEDQIVTEDEWKRAEANTLQYAEIHVGCGASNGEENIPIYGSVEDVNRFYDFFYLVSGESFWASMAKLLKVDSLYIVPVNAYMAYFIVNSDDVKDDPALKAIQVSFTKDLMKMEKVLHPFEFSAVTGAITPIE